MSLLTPVLFVALSLPSADPKPEELILGKWEHREFVGLNETISVLEFTRDGKINIEMKCPSLTFRGWGKYKVIDANTLELELNWDRKIQRKRVSFEITKDKLKMTDEKNVAECIRVK